MIPTSFFTAASFLSFSFSSSTDNFLASSSLAFYRQTNTPSFSHPNHTQSRPVKHDTAHACRISTFIFTATGRSPVPQFSTAIWLAGINSYKLDKTKSCDPWCGKLDTEKGDDSEQFPQRCKERLFMIENTQNHVMPATHNM